MGQRISGAFFFLVAALIVSLSLSQGVRFVQGDDDCNSCVMHEGNCVHSHNPDHSDKHISCFLCGSYGHCNRRRINSEAGAASSTLLVLKEDLETETEMEMEMEMVEEEQDDEQLTQDVKD